MRIAAVTAVVLLVPLVAMAFTNGVDWGAGDFAVAAALLISAGAAYELLARKGTPVYRAGVGIVVGAGLVLAWVGLAVGLG